MSGPDAQQEQNAQRSAALLASLHALKGSLSGGTEAWRTPDPVESAKSLYINGVISLDAFEARLDAVFRLGTV